MAVGADRCRGRRSGSRRRVLVLLHPLLRQRRQQPIYGQRGIAAGIQQGLARIAGACFVSLSAAPSLLHEISFLGCQLITPVSGFGSKVEMGNKDRHASVQVDGVRIEVSVSPAPLLASRAHDPAARCCCRCQRRPVRRTKAAA